MNNRTRGIVINDCRICGGHTHPLVDDELDVTYDVCQTCGFIYKQPLYHLGLDAEKSRYLSHHNADDNVSYVTYLQAFIETSIHPLQGIQTILDFGSGPNPVLRRLLEQDGYVVADYDPFFHDDKSYRDNHYDLIVLTEVLEHIHHPLSAMEHLVDLLNDQGRILIMTQFRTMNETAFLNWWYRRDTTHVGFFNDKTFATIAKRLSLTIEYSNHIDRILLSK